MVGSQSRYTISKAEDWFLQSLISIVNYESATIPITLSVSGLLISGELIGGKAYFDEFAHQFKNGFKGISSETAATIEESFKRLGNVYDSIQKESSEEADLPKPRLIHLRNAQMHQAGGAVLSSQKGNLWRGRLDSVDGFSLGRLSLDWAGMDQAPEQDSSNSAG